METSRTHIPENCAGSRGNEETAETENFNSPHPEEGGKGMKNSWEDNREFHLSSPPKRGGKSMTFEGNEEKRKKN